jgi:membrane associated rhomboid family serine protease
MPTQPMPAREYRSEIRPPSMTPGILSIIILTCACFVLLRVGAALRWYGETEALDQVGFVPDLWLAQGRLWQALTYMVVHWDPMHLLLNMLTLWWMGGRVEERMGTRRFVAVYALAGVTAAMACFAVAKLAGTGAFPVVGASGGVFAVMALWALWWPESIILLWGIAPIKVKWLVLGLLGISAVLLLTGGGNVAHEGHLGGCLAAWAWWAWDRRRGGGTGGTRRKGRVKLRLVRGNREQEERFRAIVDDL